MAEGYDGFAKRGVVEPPCLPRPYRRCSYTHPGEYPLRFHLRNRHTRQDEDRHHSMDLNEPASSHFYEELFCTKETPMPLVPQAGAFMAASGPQSDVIKEGYLGKLERSHRKYFVLRTGSHTGPSRLEWYKNQEKFTAMETSAGKAALFGANKQGVIYLRCCLGVSRSGSSRKGHMVALYDKDQTLSLVMEEQQQQEDWYLAIKTLMEEEQKDEEHEEGLDEDDDGYCTLPPAAFFKENPSQRTISPLLNPAKKETSTAMSILPVCLLVSLLLVQVSSAPPSPTERYRMFVHQHIIKAMDQDDCEKVIDERKIKIKGKQKNSNTFIIADENAVKAICLHKEGKIRSKTKFNIVVCALDHEGHYRGSRKDYQFLEVECKDDLPVHFFTQIKPRG